MGKNSLNNFISHLSWFQKLSTPHTHPLTTIREFSKPCELLFSELVTHKMLNVNWEKNSLNNFISHLSWLEKLSPAHTHSLKNLSSIFETLWVIIFWVRVTHKILNVNWEKIHSIILSVTCHHFQKLSPTHTHPTHNHSWIFETLRVIIFLS